MKVLIIGNGKNKIMTLEEVIATFRVTKAQVMSAINTGHRLKTMYFDKIEED